MRERTSALVVAAALLAGCGGDGRPDAAPTTPPPTTPAAASATPSPTPTPKPTPSIAVEQEFAHFSSPTKNIGCYVLPGAASCGISSYTWTLPPRPADCDADWGPGVSVGDDGETGVGFCASDTVIGAERILAYGTGVQVGEMRCVSERSGMTCTDLGSRHGFTLSRTSYRVF